MAIPVTIGVTINFSDGPTYGYPFLLDSAIYGIIGTNELGSTNTTALTIDYSTQTTQVAIRRGRDLFTDTYNSGQATVKILDPDGDFNPQNTSSPIYGYVKPLRKIQITGTYSGMNFNSPEYYQQVQQNYNRLFPGSNINVAEPLQQWYDTKFTPVTTKLFGV